MTIERFTRPQFEDALETIWRRITLEPPYHTPMVKINMAETVCHHIGMHQGEYCYAVFVSDLRNIRILVRSSIDYTGVAASTGEDSIRLIVQVSDGTGWYAVGKAADTYTTRVPGWQRRLEQKLLALYERWGKVRVRLNPGERLFITTKAGPNKGRAFVKGGNTRFVWVD